jgi:hypothetical protein
VPIFLFAKQCGLSISAIVEMTRICHSTGNDNGINKRTGLPEHVCRGARDLQLEFFASLGVIAEPTDEAWNDTRVDMGMKPQIISDPKKA